MNKLKLLYDVARTMKNKEKIEGVLTVQVMKGEEEVFALRNEFEKQRGGKGKTVVNSKLQLNGNQVTRESSTEFALSGDCHHGAGMVRRLFHRHHGHSGCCGIRGTFSKIACAFGVLNSLKVEERGSGAASISLDLAELPVEMQEALKERLQQNHECCSYADLLKECQNPEIGKGLLVLEVNPGGEIEKLSLALTGSVQDAAGDLRSVTASAELQLAW